MGRLLGPTVGFGLLFGATTSFAQTAGSEDITLPPVDVRGHGHDYRNRQLDIFKLPDPVKDTPQSITVVPQEVIREQAVFNLRDVLRNVSGISLAAGEGGGAQGDNLTLRGFSARNDLYIDGVRDLGQYARDAFNLESVEVLKGPSAVMFGRGSTGGVINQVSKTPQPTASYIASGTAGSGPTFRGTLDLNQPLGGSAAIRLNAMGMDADVPGRNEVHIERFGVAPSVAIGLGGPTRLTLSYAYLQDDNVPDYGFPYVFGKPADVDRDNWYGFTQRDFERDSVHIGTARLEHAFSEDIRLRTTLRYAYYHREATVSPPSLPTPPAPGTPLSAINVSVPGTARNQHDGNLTSVTDLIVKFPTRPFKHTLVTGVELARETSDVIRWTFNNVPTLNLVHPQLDADLSRMTRAKNFDATTTALAFGLYAVDEVALTEQWKIVGGLRYDLFDAEFKNTFAAQRFSRTDEMLSPRAALVFQPTKAQTYYFSYGTAFNPSAEAISLAINNAGAEPEETRTFELGAKWDLLSGALGLTSAIFEIQKTNARTTDPALGVQVLEGRQRVRGFEIGAIGRILPGWNIFAGYSYLDSRVVESLDINNGVRVQGKRIANVPANTLSLWTTYDVTDQWQVGGGVIYVGQRYANNGNTNSVPGYARGDVTVAYRPIKPLELRLNIINISDEVYFDQVNPQHVVPGAARTFLFTATVRF
jgi:catecholate siderophore receptor